MTTQTPDTYRKRYLPWVLSLRLVLLGCLMAVFIVWFYKANISRVVDYYFDLTPVGNTQLSGNVSIAINEDFSYEHHTTKNLFAEKNPGGSMEGFLTTNPGVITPDDDVKKVLSYLSKKYSAYSDSIDHNNPGPMAQLVITIQRSDDPQIEYAGRLMEKESVYLLDAIDNDSFGRPEELSREFVYHKSYYSHSSHVQRSLYCVGVNDSILIVPGTFFSLGSNKQSWYRQLFAMHNLSKAYLNVHINIPEEVSLDKLVISMGTPATFLNSYPSPDILTSVGCGYEDQESLDILASEGMTFFASFPDMEGIQEARNFLITTLLALLIAEFIRVSYLLVRSLLKK